MSDPISHDAVLASLRHWRRAGVTFLYQQPRAALAAGSATGPAAVEASVTEASGAESAARALEQVHGCSGETPGGGHPARLRDAPPGAGETPAPQPPLPHSRGSEREHAPALLKTNCDSAPAVDREGLRELTAEVAACELCPALARSRRQTVFADGDPASPLMLLGEAPGEDEDREGVPFVGAAGRKLTEIIEKGIKAPRQKVYIANILKCRPPGNRNPEPDEVHRCTVYLERQLALCRPRLIVALGRVAAHWLLETTESIGRLRGRVHEIRDGLKVIVTYHPSWLLRSYTIENRRKVFDDVKLIVAELQKQGVYPWW